MVTLNGRSHDSVDRLLNFHLRSELHDYAELLEEEVQQAVVIDQHARMNVGVAIHVIWIFQIFRSDSFDQLSDEESTIVKW